MAPVLTTLRLAGVDIPVYGYGLMLALAVLTGGCWVLLFAAQAKLDVYAVLAALAAALLAGFIGAHGLFVAVEVLGGASTLDVLGSGGIVFYGGLLAGGVVYFCMLIALHLPVGQLLDVGVPGLALAHALGRVGCFLGGCCYGKAWSGAGAVAFHDPLAPSPDGIHRYPVQLYEAGALLALALVSLAVPSREGFRGVRVAAYGVAYGVVRWVMEQFRGDLDRGLFFGGRSSTSELVSGAVIAGGVAWLFARRTARCKPSPCLSD